MTETCNIGVIDGFITKWKNMGYDFDWNPPITKDKDCPFLVSPFWEDAFYYKIVMSKANKVVKRINDDLQCTGEKYELKEVFKYVESLIFEETFRLLKLNVREVNTDVVKTVEAVYLCDDPRDHMCLFELKEWRFKAGLPEIAPYHPPPAPKIPTPAPKDHSADDKFALLDQLYLKPDTEEEYDDEDF